MNTVEKVSKQLKVGDIIVAKQGGKEYKITKIGIGLDSHHPYLHLEHEGKLVESDTSWDKYNATYTVKNQL